MPGEGLTDMATHRFIVSYGHRNTDRGGAHREIEWTPIMGKKLQEAINRRGGRAWVIQEEDGDTDPTFSHGRGLQNVARLCVDLANAVGGVDAYISCHYEGASAGARGFFGIFPDARSGVDVKANNPLDVRLCETLGRHVATTGMPLRKLAHPVAGVMSERETGVGLQGYRLGEFVGTLGFRDRTARVIIEAGNYVNPADRAMLWDMQWVDRYCDALVDGLEEVFGAFKGEAKPTPKPGPDHTPEPQYADADPIPQVKDDRPFVVLANGAVMVRANATVEATAETPRLKWATPTSPHIGPTVPKGAQFAVDYLIINPDQSLYWYTPWATRIRYEDTAIIDEPAQAA